MRRLGVLLVLLAVMLGVSALRVETSAATHPMTLAAIGFVLLAAFTVAEIGNILSLPRVTGYILTGTLLGPSVANILSSGVVAEMRMFNTLALGLIATAAGLELDARHIARLWKTLAATIATKVVLGLVLVGGALYLWERLVGTLGLGSQSALVAVALVFGALSVGTSPAIALAVTSEVRSKGRLTDLVLGAAVLKDLVVVVALAVALAVAQGLLGATGARSNDIIATLAVELGASIGVGAVLGFLLVLYLRYVRAEMLLFVAAMILVTAEVSKALHLELLLVFITAGFFVKNFSRFEHELMRPVQMVSLPVFVVFFTNAGAGIDLWSTWQVLPLALVITTSRAAVYYVAGRIGGSLGGESESVKRGAWLGYLPQAGVTLGLVGIAAAQLPELGETVLTLGMAVVAVNLLAGPVTLRIALRRAGEVIAPAARESSLPEVPRPNAEAGPELREEKLESVLARAEDRRVATFARRVAEDVGAANRALVEAHVAPWVHTLASELEPLLSTRAKNSLERMAAWSASEPTVLASDRAEFVHDVFRKARQDLRHLPDVRALPFLERHRVHDRSDGIGVRWKKRWLRTRLRFRRGIVRQAPVATCARVALESRLIRSHLEVIRRCNITEAEVLADLQRVALGHIAQNEAWEAIGNRRDALLEAARDDTERALTRGVQVFIDLLHNVGSPVMPLSGVRYSSTESEVRQLLVEIGKDSEAWTRGLEGARNAVHLAALLGEAQAATLATLVESIIHPLEASVAASTLVLRSVEAKLIELRDALVAPNAPAAIPTELQQAMRGAFGESAWTALEHNVALFRSGVSTHRVALELRRAIESLPKSMKVTDTRVLASAATPGRLPSVELAATEMWQEVLLRDLLPGVEEDVRSAAAAMVDTTQALREAEETTVYALEQLAGDVEQGAVVAVRNALGRAASRLAEQAEALTEARRSTASAISARTDAAFKSLAVALLEPSGARGRNVGRVAARRFHAALQRVRERLDRWRDGLGTTIHRVGQHDVSRDLLSRYRAEHLDATGLHGYVSRHTALSHVPPAYAKVFSLEPLVSPRLFVARRHELESLVAAERSWLQGGASSALLVGAHGAGRTSLLNQFKLELSAPRVLRPEPLQSRRELGLMTALGVSLNARPSVGSIAKALGGISTTVLVDNLEYWLTPDLAGMAELERFLELVVTTSDSTFWVTSIETAALALFEELMPVAHAFGLVVRLEPLGAPALALVIQERHRLSGRNLRHASAPLSTIRNRLPGLTDPEVSWRILAGLSDGNLSRALSLWLEAVVLDADGGVEVAAHRLLKAALPFVAWLEPRDQALLAQLLRFGPLRHNRLAQILGYARPDVVRRLAFLRAAGLIEGGRIEHDPARIPGQLRPTVAQGLRVFQVNS